VTPKPLTIAIVAGELSGDRQGAGLLEALQRIAAPRPVQAWGIGGARLRDAGMAMRHDSTPWASIGIAATLVNVPFLLSALFDMKRALARNPPDALVVIDSGAFNAPLGRWAKKHKICPVFYYFPPGSWRRTARRNGKGLADAADLVVTPFPWSETLLRQTGTNASFVGHPLLDLVKPSLPEGEFYRRYGLDPQRPLVALLPGSRTLEIKHILPAMIGAAGEITRRIPGVQFALALADGGPRVQVEAAIRREQKRGGQAARVQLLMHQAGDKLASLAHNALTPPLLATNEGIPVRARLGMEDAPASQEKAPLAPLIICEGLTYDVLARSDLVITKSGTSTLEAAILQKPMIIVYRGSGIMALEWKLRKPRAGVVHIGMPNILAQERLFPELIQDEATPDAIANLAVSLLLQPEHSLRLKEKLSALIQTTLGEPGGVARAAHLLFALTQRSAEQSL
jgi:lipid-A-disaccharide synthase